MMPKGIAKKYARALFNSLKGTDALNQSLQDFDHLSAFLEENEDIKTFLFYYPVRLDLKKETVRRLYEGYQPELQNFLLLLVEKKRFNLLPLIKEELRELIKDAQNIATAIVSTPMSLDDEQKTRIAALLQENTGKEIELVERIEPDLKGGFVIRLGEKIIDASVTGQLRRIYQQLTA